MKTHARKRIIRFTVAGVLIALVVVLLMKDRKDRQEELTTLQNYNEVVPVEIFTARLIDYTPELEESGLFLSSSEVQIVSETQGKIRSLNFQIGDMVKTGQALASVENHVVKSQFDLAKENMMKAEKDLERFQKLEGGEAATKQQLEAVRLSWQDAQTKLAEAQKQLENTTLRAPISGTISERLVEKGTWLTPGMHVCTITDQSRMNFQVKLTGDELRGVSVGQPVSLKTDAMPGYTFTGKVKNIGVAANLSGRYLVKVDVPNPGHLLRSGMIGIATLRLPVEKHKLIIPRKCIDGSLQQAQVFVVNNDQVTRRSVTVELLNTDMIAVISGLQPGEKVVTTGQINLADGTTVRVLNNEQKD